MRADHRQVTDTRDRPLRSLRVSVTDRCNLRCSYCMPEATYTWLPRRDLLSFEEIASLVRIFADLGVRKLRLTGGEPLLRKGVEKLVRLVRSDPRLEDIAITTNGLLLAEAAPALRGAGLDRVTVSLDTLRPERFEALTHRSGLDRVLEGIEAVRRAGFEGTKIDTVVLRGTNEDELGDLIELGKRVGAEVRFIEYMDVGGATRWSLDQVYTKAEILADLETRYGSIEPVEDDSWAPARRYRLADGTVFGVIASTTEPFCRTCDRSRLTADGLWFLCLYARAGIDLRGPLRGGASPAELRDLLRAGWAARTDRGAEQRAELTAREALVPADHLRRDPHLEMHTRGG